MLAVKKEKNLLRVYNFILKTREYLNQPTTDSDILAVKEVACKSIVR